MTVITGRLGKQSQQAISELLATIDETNFAEVTKSNRLPVLLDLSATW